MISNRKNKPTKGYPIYVQQPALVNAVIANQVRAKKEEILTIIKSRQFDSN